MITEDYVSVEIAKLLNEKGFDEVCFKYALNGEIYNNGDFVISHVDDVEVGIPTLQMAVKWLEEVHNILLIPDYDYECTDKSWCYKIYQLGENGKPKRVPVEGVSYDMNGEPHVEVVAYRDYQRSFADYATKEEAIEDGIKYCLENLI